MSKPTPMEVTTGFLSQNYLDSQGNRTLHFYHDQFWKYDGQRWRPFGEDLLLWRQLHKWIEENFAFTPTGAAWSVYQRSLKFEVTLDTGQAMPAHLGAVEPDTETIAFENGILRLYNMKFIPHSPTWFSSNCLPYRYDPEAKCDKWLEYLSDTFEGDDQRIALLQEWFGYCLTPDTSFHRAMVFYGATRSGKGTCSYVLRNMLGKENVGDVRLEMLGERFQLAQLEGKLLDVAEEAERVRHFHEGIFKSMIAGESVPLEKKGRDSVSRPLGARILIISNDQIPFTDTSGAVERRLEVLPFYKSVPDGEEILDLPQKLCAELPGIFNWALEGRKRLHTNKRFTKTGIGSREKAELILANNHVLDWADRLEIMPDGYTLGSSIYEDYEKWCKANGVPAGQRHSSRALVGKARDALKLPRDWKPIPHRAAEGQRVWPRIRLRVGEYSDHYLEENVAEEEM